MSLGKTSKVRKALKRKGSPERKKLATDFWSMRAGDIGRGTASYKLDRSLHHIPFTSELISAIKKKASQGKIEVLEKGTGSGNTLAEIKRFFPGGITTTALTLTRAALKPENMPFIDRTIKSIGITKWHEKKYDIIFDAFGEDFHLPKSLVKHSIEKTISHLKKGGEAFTVFPVSYLQTGENFTVKEVGDILKDLKKIKGIQLQEWSVKRRTYYGTEYLEQIIHITRLPRN